MVEAILFDRKTVLPCAALLEGEYGIDGLFAGVPVRLGSGGVEKVIEMELSPSEQDALTSSADAVQELVTAMELHTK